MIYVIVNSKSSFNGNGVVILGLDDSVVINKNISDVEFLKMKIELVFKNIDFMYRNVKRNDVGEIVVIKILIDNNEGLKFILVIKGDDDEFIDLIIIY